MRRHFVIAALAFCLAVAGSARGGDDDFNALMARGQSLLRSNQTDDAIRAYKKAIKLNPSSGMAYWRLAQAYTAAQAYKDAVAACERGLQVADTDRMKAILHEVAGDDYEAMAGNDPGKLKLAEQQYRAAAALSTPPPLAHFRLGRVLMKMDRDGEGAAELKQFLDEHQQAPADSPIRSWMRSAELMIANPQRARKPFMPEFSLKLADGKVLSSEDLAGKIVVLDFWATWCPPCRASLPEVRSLTQKFANDPVVLLSISADRDEAAWRKFIADNKMDWPQYFDEHRRISRLFGVHSYPTYLMVDTEGVVRQAEHGSGSLRWIENEIRKELKAAARSKPQAAADRP
jgi:peroxiredoxin